MLKLSLGKKIVLLMNC